MQEKLCFVQFPHPGAEHVPDQDDIKFWHAGPHKRKFVKNTGCYLAGSTVATAEIAFWCEWEPESRVVRRIEQPLPMGPRYVYEPYYVLPQSYQHVTNTDPFVFGERFYYTWCRQKTDHHSRQTQLCYLAAGSVILFGSCKGGAFVLDTVFVISETSFWHDYGNYKRALHGRIPDAYGVISIAPGYHEPFNGGAGCARADDYHLPNRLYVGASYDQPYDGMFSFFPCYPYDSDDLGFERPRIVLPGIVTDTLARAVRYNPQPDQAAAKKLWTQVVQQVQDQGLLLGISTVMPDLRVGASMATGYKENPHGSYC